MKHLKKFEIISNNISIGDYVLVKYRTIKDNALLKQLSNFINNTIGIVVKINDSDIYVKFENIPNNLILFFSHTNFESTKCILKYNIIDFSKTKEDLELKIQTQKFNI